MRAGRQASKQRQAAGKVGRVCTAAQWHVQNPGPASLLALSAACCPQHLDDSFSQGSQGGAGGGGREGASPTTSQMSDSDAATYSHRRGNSGGGRGGTRSPDPRPPPTAGAALAAAGGQEADSQATPPAPPLLRHKSQGYTSDQSGACLGCSTPLPRSCLCLLQGQSVCWSTGLAYAHSAAVPGCSCIPHSCLLACLPADIGRQPSQPVHRQRGGGGGGAGGHRETMCASCPVHSQPRSSLLSSERIRLANQSGVHGVAYPRCLPTYLL